jgi:murein DD-endopeptidase MepM/ murein hydrolase activator NlpD
MDLNMHANGTGEIVWPLNHVDHVGDGFLARGGEHQGVDLLDPARTPIFAAAAGVVRASQDSYGGYGCAVAIDSVINGQVVTTIYGHMTYGTRTVVVGQTVSAGQLIGGVGMTGVATANHLHFEVHINGVHVDPLAWLEVNAGPIP